MAPPKDQNSAVRLEDLMDSDSPRPIPESTSRETQIGDGNFPRARNPIGRHRIGRNGRNRYAGQHDLNAKETLMERIIELKGMFPAPIRNLTYNLAKYAFIGATSACRATRSASSYLFPAAAILVLPVFVVTQQARVADLLKNQSMQILLGSAATVAAEMPSLF